MEAIKFQSYLNELFTNVNERDTNVLLFGPDHIKLSQPKYNTTIEYQGEPAKEVFDSIIIEYPELKNITFKWENLNT